MEVEEEEEVEEEGGNEEREVIRIMVNSVVSHYGVKQFLIRTPLTILIKNTHRRFRLALFYTGTLDETWSNRTIVIVCYLSGSRSVSNDFFF